MSELSNHQHAKELFLASKGSLIRMHRDGVLTVYKQYEIAKETEHEWLLELVEQMTRELSIMNTLALADLELVARSNPGLGIFERIAKFASVQIMSADSIVKLLYAETIVRLYQLHKPRITDEWRFKSYRLTADVLEDIIAKPLILDQGRELRTFELRDKKALNNRAQLVLKALSEIFG